jgi:hypothetical protein
LLFKEAIVEPITATIVTALASGAAAAAKNVATSAIKDAYAALKQLITDRYRKASPFVEAIEANPTSEPEQKVLANQLGAANADPQLEESALTLLKALEDLHDDPRAQAVLDFKKLRAAKNFELTDIEFSGTLLHADDANFEGDFKATQLRQRRSSEAQPEKN